MIKYLKIKDNLYLAQQVVRPDQQKEQVVELSTQHIFVIDCSGSMSGELSTIRKDLFNKISTVLKPSDSVTIIWFSGRNEYGVILEDYTVHSNIALEKVREIINKYNFCIYKIDLINRINYFINCIYFVITWNYN